MAYEFKKLSDVDVVAEPIETANVLIEENGVIKKAPKTAVGGAGGATYDVILDFGDQSVSIENSSFDYSKVSLIGSTYDELITKLQNGEVPKIAICYNYVYGDYVYRMTSESLSVNYYNEVIDIVTLVRGYGTTGTILHLEIYSNGTCGGGLAN